MLEPSGSSPRSAESAESEPYLLINRQRKHRVDRARMLDFLSRLIGHLLPGAPFSVVLVSDRIIRQYNRDYWHDLRLLSSAGSTFKTDLNFQDEAGRQFSGVSVFGRAADGSPGHFYSATAIMGAGEFRGIDLLSPVWNLLDLTPSGRGEWLPSLALD